MDRNSVIGLVLIGAILITFTLITRPNIEEVKRQQAVKDSIAAVNAEKHRADSIKNAKPLTAVVTPDSLEKLDDTAKNQLLQVMGPFSGHVINKQRSVTLENELIKVTLTNKGGMPYSVELKQYRKGKADEDTGEVRPVVLFEGDESRLNYNFATVDGHNINTSGLYFDIVQNDSSSVSMVLRSTTGQMLEQRYSLAPNSYELNYEMSTTGFGQLLNRSNNYLVMDWTLNMPLQEKSVKLEREKSTVYYRHTNGDHDNIGERDFEEEKLDAGVQWISFKQQFFNSTLINNSKEGFSDVKVKTVEARDDNHVKVVGAEMYLPHDMGQKETHSMRFFFGPNHYQTLSKLDIGMEKLVPLGWGIFGWVNRYAVIPVFNWLDDYFNSYGLIILILTLIIKAVLFPLVYKSYISTAKMRVLKPEMDEIKEKFAKEPQKLQMENMKLFRKAGVSPLGGCLPMLLQMPILIALFIFFPVSFELRQEPFLWASDLSTYDSIWTFGEVPIINFLYGDHVSLFTLLMTISTLLYTKMNNDISGLSGQMKYIGYIMPIVFLGVFNNYSAGLSYYYFLSNMVTFGQQWVMRRFVDEDKLHKQIQENKKKPLKKTRFQERLEKMAKDRGLDTRRK